MPAASALAYGATVLAGVALFCVIVRHGVKLRAAARRGGGVRVYDFGADLTLPRALHSRSYRVALYLTMKSLPREPSATASGKINAPAAIR